MHDANYATRLRLSRHDGELPTMPSAGSAMPHHQLTAIINAAGITSRNVEGHRQRLVALRHSLDGGSASIAEVEEEKRLAAALVAYNELEAYFARCPRAPKP